MDPITITALAATVGKILAPALPFLKAAAKPLAESAGKKIGETMMGSAMDLAKTLWQKLQPHAQERPALIEAADDLVKNPDDKDAATVLTHQLKKLLEANTALAAEFQTLINNNSSIIQKTQTAQAIGAGSVAVNEMTGNITITNHK